MKAQHFGYILLLAITMTACFSTRQTPIYNNTNYHAQYESILDPGSTIYKAYYHYVVEENTNGSYIYKQFNPDKGVLTDYMTYLDKDLLVKNGKAMKFWDNGNKRSVGTFRNNKASGTWSYYNFDDGLLYSQGEKLMGLNEGKWTSYRGGDTIRSTKTYLKGKLHGTSTYFNKAGAIVKKVMYENGDVVNKEVNDSEPNETMPYFKSTDCKNISEQKELQACSQRKMLEAIYKNIRYPSLAREMSIEGTALINFVIDQEGKMSDIKVRRGLCKEIEAECLRILPFISDWNPGIQDGKKVKVRFNLPIKFRLE